MKFVIKPLLVLNWLVLTYSKPVKVPFHYETQSQQSTYNRPGSSGSQYTSVTQFQPNRPSAGNDYEYGPSNFGTSRVSSLNSGSSLYSTNNYLNNDFGRKIFSSKFTTSNFNRLPARPEFDDYEDIDDGDDNGVDSGEQVTNSGQSSPQSQLQYGNGGYVGNFKPLRRKKKRGVICVPHGNGGLFGGLFGGGPFGSNAFGGGSFGGFNPFRLGSFFRSNEDGQDIESRAYEDPRFLIKAPQFNFYNGGGSYYKPSSGYPCQPVNFYGQRPGFGQFGYFGDTVSGGGNRPGVQSDEPDRPVRPGGALGILSDTVKPIVESTAIQDGIGSTISNWSPGQGIANVLNAVGGITGQFATAPVAAVKQTQQIYRDFRDLIF